MEMMRRGGESLFMRLRSGIKTLVTDWWVSGGAGHEKSRQQQAAAKTACLRIGLISINS